jgi:formylmethanofuran dehydrogenase subunit E
MSEVNSSENNSIMSEANSSDEISNTHSNSYESPSSAQLKLDDFNRQADEIATFSLPVLTSSSSSSISPNTMFSSRVIDSELSSLLTRKQPKFTPQAPKCAKCDKNVYKAEEIRAANKTYHKLCFKCTSCNKLLEANNLTEHQGDLFCRNCYGRNFGPKGYGYGQGAGILSGEYVSPKSPNAKPITTLKSTFSSIPLT